MPWVELMAVQNALIDKFLRTLDEARQPRSAPIGFPKHIWNLRHAVEFRGPRSLMFDRSRLAGTPREIDLFEGLMMHRLKKATDPRDKIYAMVGLTTAATDLHFVIDYGIPAEQVFINTVNYVLKTCGSLDIILIHTKSYNGLSLPTWVPNFGSWGSSSSVPFSHASSESVYASSATKKAEAVIDCGKGVLSARGVCISSVAFLAPSIEKDGLQRPNNLVDGSATVRLWRSFIYQNTSRLADLRKLLLCDIRRSVEPVPDHAETHFFDIYSLFEEDVWRDEKDLRDQSPFNSEGMRKRERAEALAIIHNIFMRRLFVTGTGAIGMAQDSILEGDLVCILFGCSIPVILRRFDGHHLYISDACVVGYMYGRGIEELEAGKLEAELFEIH